MPVQVLHCLGTLAAYIVLCLTILIALWRLIRMPSFVFRKRGGCIGTGAYTGGLAAKAAVFPRITEYS